MDSSGEALEHAIHTLALDLHIIVTTVRQHGVAKGACIIALRGGTMKTSRHFIVAGAGTMAAVAGSNSCVSLVTGKNYQGMPK